MFTCYPCLNHTLTMNSESSTCVVRMQPSQSWRVILCKSNSTSVRCKYQHTSFNMSLSEFQNIFGSDCLEALLDHNAVMRYTASKKYRHTSNGRLRTQNAVNKYRYKNREHAYRRCNRYTEQDLEFFDKVIAGELTVSEAAVVLERSNQAVQSKLYRIRHSM